MEMKDMEHILKILTLAETSERIGIVLGPDAGDAELLAAHALKERLGEKTSLLNATDHLQDRWSHMFKKERPRKEVALALDTSAHPVDELRYEKENGVLRIFLSPHNKLTKDAFTMEERHLPSDMIIALGFSNEEDLRRIIKTEAPLKNPDAVINLSSIGALADNLWSLDSMKLLGRALLRSYREDDTNTFWAFLPKEDFQKTNQSDTILPALIRSMRRFMKLPLLVVVLWQSPKDTTKNVHILLSSTDPHTLTKLADAAETPAKDDMIIVRSFENFSEAELEARKLIKQI
ncbi:MAG: hypothetical protein G01um101429_173 [Parcubacteria group bacterium Gr01-1014_29]|nr:MAG: hypothetical protein G01um101429_173 [Parcubacteria group bacterium Gr01-1014_29]